MLKFVGVAEVGIMARLANELFGLWNEAPCSSAGFIRPSASISPVMMRWHRSARGHDTLISFKASTQLRRLYCAVINAEEDEDGELLPSPRFIPPALFGDGDVAVLRKVRTPERCAIAPVKIR